MNKISAKIIADSADNRGNRITTFVLTYPRFIHSELMTHRMFSRNSASSRAIPFDRMLKSVMEDPFIPIAVQKQHKGMQGTEYIDITYKYTFEELQPTIHDFLVKNFKKEDNTWKESYLTVDTILNTYVLPILYKEKALTWREWWLKIRDLVVSAAIILYSMGISKQLCNRLLEPFMWHTIIVTATEFEGFF